MRHLWLLGPACVDQTPKTQRVPAKGAGAERNGAAVPRFRSRRTVALLGYHVAEQRLVARGFWAALSWPDEATSKGCSNLRRELHNLAQILPDCWEMDRQAVAFVPSDDVTIDLDTVLQLEAEERWQEAAELLGGELLEGLHLDDNLESCKQALWEELGVEPAGETAALCQQIQAGVLDLPPQLPTFLTDEGARHRVDRPLFVAGERELAQLDAFLEGALAGQGRVVLITGGPGRVKTALLDAFARRAMEAHPNLLVASGNCTAYSDVRDPYLPFRDVMVMLTGAVEAKWDTGAITRDHAQRLWAALPLVVQALLDHGPHLLDVLVPGSALLSRAIIAEPDGAPWLTRLRAQVSRQATSPKDVEQSYLFQQITEVLRTVARGKLLLLILDDIQWADAASVSLLFHLGRRLAAADDRIIVACAYRPEEAVVGRNGERHVLARVLSEIRRTFGDVWLDLGQADRREGRRFIDALLDAEPNRLAGGVPVRPIPPHHGPSFVCRRVVAHYEGGGWSTQG